MPPQTETTAAQTSSHSRPPRLATAQHPGASEGPPKHDPPSRLPRSATRSSAQPGLLATGCRRRQGHKQASLRAAAAALRPARRPAGPSARSHRAGTPARPRQRRRFLGPLPGRRGRPACLPRREAKGAAGVTPGLAAARNFTGGGGSSRPRPALLFPPAPKAACPAGPRTPPALRPPARPPGVRGREGKEEAAEPRPPHLPPLPPARPGPAVAAPRLQGREGAERVTGRAALPQVAAVRSARGGCDTWSREAPERCR